MGQFCSKDNAFQAEASTMQQPTQAVHEMLAKLDTLKKQIDSGSVEDLPAIERELDQAGVTVRTQNFEVQWRDNIMMLIQRYKASIAEKRGGGIATSDAEKKRRSTALVLHELLAKLETLKKQIDSGSVEDLPAIERELDQAGVTVRTQNFEVKWRDNIMMLISRYKANIEEKRGGLDTKDVQLDYK